jgi:hypothetical protein
MLDNLGSLNNDEKTTHLNELKMLLESVSYIDDVIVTTHNIPYALPFISINSKKYGKIDFILSSDGIWSMRCSEIPVYSLCPVQTIHLIHNELLSNFFINNEKFEQIFVDLRKKQFKSSSYYSMMRFIIQTDLSYITNFETDNFIHMNIKDKEVNITFSDKDYIISFKLRIGVYTIYLPFEHYYNIFNIIEKCGIHKFT